MLYIVCVASPEFYFFCIWCCCP